jgi:prephenate dehydrogenase
MTPSRMDFASLLGLKSVGILGRGKFGTFMEERLKEALGGASIRSFDPKERSPHTESDVVTSDAVILAIPPLTMESEIPRVARNMRRGSVLVDVCSVKIHTAHLMDTFVPDGVHYLLTHPLFGPQSFEDNGRSLKDLEMTVCGGQLPKALYETIQMFFKSLGLRVERMTPEEHDRGPSIEQLIVQFQGLLHHRAGFMLNGHQIHTRSAKYYYQAMNIVRDDEALFHQIAELNPFWPEAKAKLLAEYRKEIERMAA